MTDGFHKWLNLMAKKYDEYNNELSEDEEDEHYYGEQLSFLEYCQLRLDWTDVTNEK